MFWGDFWETLIGMELIQNPPIDMFRQYVPDISAFFSTGYVPGETLVCTGKIKHPGKSTHVPAFEFVKTLVPEEKHRGIKVTIPPPGWYHLRYREGKAYPTDVYPSIDDYFHDIAIAYQTEFDLLYQAGVRNVQLDDPNCACQSPSPVETR
jgi:methionine synthase II (cobalamin-independent)